MIEYSASARQVVGVVDDQRLAGHGHVAGQALARDREDLFLERVDVDGVVLRELPAQHLAFAVNVIEEVERSGIGARQLAGLAEDHREQDGVIADRRERDPDLARLPAARVCARELPLELVGAHFLVEELIRALHRR